MSFISVFDVLGPNMIGPSSSHTAGAAVIGGLAGKIIAPPLKKVDFTLYGSFAKTYRGHGTDRALAAGIMGMLPSDPRIRDSLSIARSLGLRVDFSTGTVEDAHPNTAVLTLWDASGRSVEVQGASVGGGNILITRFNGMDVAVTGQYTTLIVQHWDRPGMVAEVASLLGEEDINIASFRLSRESRGGQAVMTIELDAAADGNLVETVRTLPGVLSATLISPN